MEYIEKSKLCNTQYLMLPLLNFKICLGCEKTFILKHKNAKFCSKNCYWRWYYGVNKKEITQKHSDFYKSHKQHRNKIAQNWKTKNPEKIKEYCKRSYKKHLSERRRKGKERNEKFKKELVIQLGGKCVRCGYNKYFGALEFHHLNPETKESEYDWKRKDFDITKVILVCSNCHKEIHHEIKIRELEEIKPLI